MEKKKSSMLEKIGQAGFESISKPSPDALEVLSFVIEEKAHPIVAEIGVGIGATTLEFCKLLNEAELHLYDFEDRVDELAKDLKEAGVIEKINLHKHGNGRQTFNSYAWTLASQFLDEVGKEETHTQFDFAYLDGAHSFHHDAPACVILKEMIAEGGYLVIDDVHWSFNKSPSMNPQSNPQIVEQYSEEQLDRPHVEMVVRALVETDDRFERIYLTENRNPYRAVFKRKNGPSSRVGS